MEKIVIGILIGALVLSTGWGAVGWISRGGVEKELGRYRQLYDDAGIRAGKSEGTLRDIRGGIQQCFVEQRNATSGIGTETAKIRANLEVLERVFNRLGVWEHSIDDHFDSYIPVGE
ncbi:MAG: hypothetical protein LBH42_10110 [Treponema sp.]|jgi:hypothetical protein|nr:hypothetical protein [Treponema sp.]